MRGPSSLSKYDGNHLSTLLLRCPTGLISSGSVQSIPKIHVTITGTKASGECGYTHATVHEVVPIAVVRENVRDGVETGFPHDLQLILGVFHFWIPVEYVTFNECSGR